MKVKLFTTFLVFSLSLNSAMAVSPLEFCSNLFRRSGNTISDNPYSKAFRRSVKKTQSIPERTIAFQNKWPNRVKLVDDVTFKFEDALASGQRKQKMLAISLKDLTPAEEQLFLQDYVDYLSWNSVSFPLGERGGHLHTRVGSLDLSFLSGLSQETYRFPSSKRLETMVELAEEEFTNLRQFAHNIDKQGADKVLGDFAYDGIPDDIPNATLFQNKSSAGHNCTSWISTAPIGTNGETLKSLVGTGGLNVGTNPGWWTSFLQTRGRPERVPYIIYITRGESLDAIERSARGQIFNWDYGLH